MHRQLYQYHDVIGLHFVPGIKARVPHEGGGYLVRTNDTGFRSNFPFEEKAKDGVRRILLFGDSFTAGEGVSNGQRYGDYLSEMIPHLEVYNFGLPATGTDQHYLVYKEFASKIECNLVIIGIFVENIRRVASHYRHFQNERGEMVLYEKPYFTLEGDDLSLHGVPPAKNPVDESALPSERAKCIFTGVRFPCMKKLYNRLLRHPRLNKVLVKSGMKDMMLKLVRYQPLPEYNNNKNEAWLTMRAIIRHWISECRQPVIVLPIPFSHYISSISNPAVYQRRFHEAVEGTSGVLLDPLPGLRKHSKGEISTYYYANDGHLTKAGHKALAEAMLSMVSDLLNQEERNY